MLNTAAGSRCEVSRTTIEYVPYPKLRVSVTSAHVHWPDDFAMRRCSAPSASVHALLASYLFMPPRSLGTSRILHSYPPKTSVFETPSPALPRFAIATATTSPPGVGRSLIDAGGWYPGSTSRAAYSVPTCVEFVHVESGFTVVSTSLTSGCTHHAPFFAYSTICCPA